MAPPAPPVAPAIHQPLTCHPSLQESMKHLALPRLSSSSRLVGLLAVLLVSPTFAAKEAPTVPDLTQGGKLADAHD